MEPKLARATLLIPLALEPHMNALYRRYGGLRGLLGVLLRRYGRVAEKLIRQHPPRISTRYQSENLKLQRRHFRAVGQEWAWVRCLARSCGVSICYFVVVLIELELSGDVDDTSGGALPIHNRVRHLDWVNLKSGRLYRIGSFRNNADLPLKRAYRHRKRR